MEELEEAEELLMKLHEIDRISQFGYEIRVKDEESADELDDEIQELAGG